MFSNSSKYAIKAVLFLALNSNDEKKIMVKDIAGPINVPQAYIAKLLQELSRQEVISSSKGPKGGFYLNENNKKATIIDIINVIDGEEPFQSCFLSLKECNSIYPCALHHLIFNEKQIIQENLAKTTIEELSRHIIEGRSVLPL